MMQVLWCLLLCCSYSCSFAAVYIVDGSNGDDANTGLSTTSAFKTIKHCVRELQNPGDECQLRKGRYHEAIEISSLKGTAEKPFIIRGFDDDRPIWDGTVVIQPKKWHLDSKTGICSAAIDHDITALFLNDDLLTAARWPNALWSDRTCFNNSFWGKSDKSSTRGRMVDDGTQGLAESAIDATGAAAILNIGSFNTFVGPVTHHEAGNNTFFYDDIWNSSHNKPEKNQYFLEASLALLDAPEEWFYDIDTKVLYLIPSVGNGCPDPSSDALRGRTIDYGLTVRDTTGLTVANLTFFACNIDAQSEKKESYIDHITFENLDILFGASSHRMIRNYLKPKWTKIAARVSRLVKDSEPQWINGKLVIVNCTFLGTEGLALGYAGAILIHNNLFAWNDWTGHMMDKPMGGLATTHGDTEGEEFSQNTLWYNGASVAIRPGNHANISYNQVVGQCAGLIMNDGAGIHLGTGPQNGADINHNWVRDSPKMGYRFDGGGNAMGTNGTMRFNVAFNCSGFILKGDNHTVESNLALDKQSGPDEPDEIDGCNICVIYRLRHDPVIENNNTLVFNNGATLADGGKDLDNHSRFPLPGKIIENNYSGTNVQDNLYDSYNWDFRPLKNSNFTDGDVIGPYLPGFQHFYWIPGRKLYKTSNPIPRLGAQIGSDRDVLMFLGAYRADHYHWFMGTEERKVFSAEEKDDEYQGKMKEGSNVLELPQLESATHYYWRVDAAWGGYNYKGDVWSFYTKEKL